MRTKQTESMSWITQPYLVPLVILKNCDIHNIFRVQYNLSCKLANTVKNAEYYHQHCMQQSQQNELYH